VLTVGVNAGQFDMGILENNEWNKSQNTIRLLVVYSNQVQPLLSVKRIVHQKQGQYFYLIVYPSLIFIMTLLTKMNNFLNKSLS
jgi:hypothetical protein